MKKLMILSLVMIQQLSISGQQVYTVSNIDLVFNPTLVTVEVGDIVRFAVGTFHPVLQVSEATWNVNGSTALPGGFSFPSGDGDYNAITIGTFYYICTAHIFNGMKGRIVVTALTGIEDTNPDGEVKVFPNPAENYIIYQAVNDLSIPEIRIIDSMGKVVKVVKRPALNGGQVRLDIENLNDGFYFILVKSGNTVLSRKFIKS